MIGLLMYEVVYAYHIYIVSDMLSQMLLFVHFLDILPSVANWKTHLFLVLVVFFTLVYKQFSQWKLPSVN